MRVLLATTAGAGHFGPLVPFGRACREAGLDVAVAAPGSFRRVVESAGFPLLPFDDVAPEVMGPVMARLPGLPRQEANAVVLGEVFGRLDAQAALPGLEATIRSWRPHVVLREPCEFASWVAAEAVGIPQVIVGIGLRRMHDVLINHAAGALGELRSRAGLADEPSLDSLRSAPYFTLVPPTLDTDTDAPVPTALWRFRDSASRLPVARLPVRWGDPDLPLVYVTFGSVTAAVGTVAAIYPAVIDALADFPARVLLTTGEGMDAVSLGPCPANLHLERWWPQADVMAACSAVVGHGGFGTTLTTLAAGVAQVVVPLFAADQYLNGARVAEIGAGVCLDGEVAAAHSVPGALHRVLGDPSFGAAARLVAAEIASLPDPSEAVPVIERLAAGA